MSKKKWAPNARPDAKDYAPETEHFATRPKANDFIRIMRYLPDPDPILKKMGRGISELQELLTDSHLESVWGVRCAAASGAEWFMAPAENGGAREQEAADAFAAELKGMDVPRIIEEMMDAVAYGYSPLEILWTPRDGRWGIQDIVGKPPQWFIFNSENRLLFKAGKFGTEELPENRFLLVRNRPSYANPYGVKAFSKCFWPVTFKRNGFRWWTVFVEKYGGAFTSGEYPLNTPQHIKDELLTALEKLAADSVAIFPEGTKINITTAGDKQGSSSVHEAFIQMCNAETSKAILGETLTTEIGDTGSYAAAQTHNKVREDIAAADRRRIGAAFNGLAKLWTFFNFGEGVGSPTFEFVQDEDLQTNRADRDAKLCQQGWRPTKEYFMRQYGMHEDDFTIQESYGGDSFPGFSQAAPVGNAHENHVEKHFEGCPCGCQNVNKKRTPWHKFAALFASKEEKEREKNHRTMDQFEEKLLEDAQEETDKTIDALVDPLGHVNDYDEAIKVLESAYARLSPGNCAALISEARYAAGQIGAASVKGGRRNG